MHNNNATSIETLFEKGGEFGKTNLEILRLKGIGRVADFISSFATKVAISIIVALFIIILSVGAALWIGEYLGNSFYGLFIIAGIYAFVAIVLYVFRNKWLKTPISHLIIGAMHPQKKIWVSRMKTEPILWKLISTYSYK